ncbi:hypothetical protein OTB20_17680 [Streptomyces sp. H27-H1]|uniref:hypothetical protein n=1 Tax=Streptomyces sp. H27-H1 TaxID=2996461 RepID=UPI00226E4F60|nr:hypothetical protein [Streptomyces sp. H27-H1]MCY0927996.1 hypothetical protein [Streptomyces sp. H27-H1]
MDWLRGAPAPYTTYLVHGAESAAGASATGSTPRWGGRPSYPSPEKPSWSADPVRRAPATHRAAHPILVTARSG